MSTVDLIKAALEGAYLNQEEYRQALEWINQAAKQYQETDYENQDRAV